MHLRLPADAISSRNQKLLRQWSGQRFPTVLNLRFTSMTGTRLNRGLAGAHGLEPASEYR